MGKWASMMSNMSMSCGGNHNANVRRFDFHNVLNFLIDKEQDSRFCAAVLSGMPKELMQKYFEERKAVNYEPPDFNDETGGL